MPRGLRFQISMGLGDTHDHVTHAEMTTELRTDNSATLKQWGQFAWEICQGGGSDSPNQRMTYSESDEEYNIEDEDDVSEAADVDVMAEAKNAKSNKIVDSKNELDDYSDDSVDSDDSEDEDSADEDDEEDDEEDDDDDDDDEEEQERENILDAANGIQKIEQGILTGKQADEDDDGEYEDDGASVDDVVILENGSMFAVSSVWIVVACILFGISMLLLVVVKVLTEVMKRRGERYRQALLASKNSFVYQKLTEDIVPSKVPKIHRYEPINQV